MYFTQDIVTSEWVTKKAFYKSVGAQDFTTWEIVQTRQFVGEYTQDELLSIRQSIIDSWIPTEQELLDRKNKADLEVASIDEKLAMFI